MRYDSTLSLITHHNSIEHALAKMTQSQRSLVESYDSLLITVFDEESEKKARQRIKEIIKEEFNDFYGEVWRIGACIYEKKDYTKEEAIETFLEKSGGLKNYLERGWVIRDKNEGTDAAWSVYVGLFLRSYTLQKPHKCGGFGEGAGYYHIVCTNCDEEIRFWELGVDYDLG